MLTDLHVLFGGHDKLVVHNVVGGVTEAIEGAARVHVARHARPAVDVLPHGLELGGILIQAS